MNMSDIALLQKKYDDLASELATVKKKKKSNVLMC